MAKSDERAAHSCAAQLFFHRFGFVIVEQRAPVIRGVVVPNA
jgi:hypothetical protein